ncbi:MAG: hypothetical protein CMO01_06345 [Thalassobius sp.]|nr:hypothetical protein [Thalassovita sp.]
MKNYRFYFFIFFALLFTKNVFAQAPQNVIKLNIFSPIVRTLSVSYERALSTDNSFQVNVLYTGYSIDDTKLRGFGITPEYRFYLSESKDAPAGFYIGPFLRYQNLNLEIEGTTDEATLSTFGGGLLIGGQWLFKDKISLDTFIGPSYNAGSVDVKDGADEDTFSTGIFSGFGVRFGVTVGYAF